MIVLDHHKNIKIEKKIIYNSGNNNNLKEMILI